MFKDCNILNICAFFNNKKYILEEALSADFAFIKADVADRYGNLTFNKTARNFNPIMCMAAKQSLIQTKKIIEPDLFKSILLKKNIILRI